MSAAVARAELARPRFALVLASPRVAELGPMAHALTSVTIRYEHEAENFLAFLQRACAVIRRRRF